MRFPNEVIHCLPDILVTASLSICPLKLTKAVQLQPLPFLALVHPFSLHIKGKVLLVTSPLMCARDFSMICNNVEMQRAEYVYLTDSEGSTGYFAFHFYFVLQFTLKRFVYFDFNLIF